MSNIHESDLTRERLSKYIDHTILKPDAKEDAIINLCAEAVEHSFASVCINPTHVKLAYENTKNSSVKVCTVVGFPLGANLTEVKVYETEKAMGQGAEEIDMVINIGALKDGNFEYVKDDIQSVVNACVQGKTTCKVIIETVYLSEEEKIKACELAMEAGAHYVKTSTGFGPKGATVSDVELMKRIVSRASIGIKAAGGIRTYADACAMIAAGATRIGASASVKIIEDAIIER